MTALREQVFRRKPVEEMAAETGADTGKSELKRTIGLWSLSAIGIGGTIGTGIFFILSQAVPMAGPAVIFSFLLAGLVAGLTAVCYAELAGAVPVAGSSYSYTYATLGEFVAMGVGACLLLEWGVAGAAVAVGWSEYLNQFIGNVFGVQIPEALSNAPEQGGIINLPAVILIIMCAALLIRGTSESAKTNAIMVIIKICVLIMFIVIGVQGWNADNLDNFAPFGFAGVTAATGVIFFSFVGLDSVAAAGEEAKNPQTKPPAGDHDRAGHRHTAVRVGCARRGGGPVDREVRRSGGGAGPDPRERGRLVMAGHRDRRRSDHLDLQRHPGVDLRTDPNPVRDVA